jgi:hypothetical protein
MSKVEIIARRGYFLRRARCTRSRVGVNRRQKDFQTFLEIELKTSKMLVIRMDIERNWGRQVLVSCIFLLIFALF